MKTLKTIVILIAAVGVAGCRPRIATETSTFVPKEAKCVVAIVIDMSGSFQHLMSEEGKAYQFALQVIDTYFKNHIGTSDRLIISQISDTQALLWDGKPLELRRDFPTPGAFREFLKSKSSDGSPVHLAMARTMEYLMSITDSSTKLAIFVLSDMEDNDVKSLETKTRTLTALKEFGQRGGVVGLYYVSDRWLGSWKTILSDAAIKEFCVESEIVSRPELPNLE